MVRNNSKLNKIIQKHLQEVKNLKYYSNNVLYEEIFNEYNKDLPLCYNIKNNVKNRKMVLNKVIINNLYYYCSFLIYIE